VGVIKQAPAGPPHIDGVGTTVVMKGQELLEIIFAKLYEEISDATYDWETVLKRLFDIGLISEKRSRIIGSKQETFERNK